MFAAGYRQAAVYEHHAVHPLRMVGSQAGDDVRTQ